MTDVRTDNDFLISGNRQRGGLVAMMPVRVTTRQQAYRTAAWLRLLADLLPDEDPASSFDEVLDAIANT